MSLFTYRSSLLTIAPRVWERGRSLHARTSGLLRLLSLFSYDRHIEVNAKRKNLSIRTRKLWLLTSFDVVRFSELSYIDYGFSSVGTSWNMTPISADRADQLESFRVSVVTTSGRKIPVASFRGEGAVQTGTVGVLLGDSVVDAEGVQQDLSRQFVDRLEKILQIPLGRPLLEQGGKSSTASARACEKCGRPAPVKNQTCLYCGGSIALAK